MDDRDYVIKEARTLYKYILEGKERFESKKHLYARIYNNLESNSVCDCGGLDNFDLSKEEIKEIIKNEVENYKE